MKNNFIPVLFEASSRLIGLIFIFYCIIFLFRCGIDVEDASSPIPPIWLEKSIPEKWPERGIDAQSSGGIFMECAPDSSGEIAAYKIYRATYDSEVDTIGEFQLYEILNTIDYNNFKYVDQDVEVFQRYYYRIKAEDTSGNSSDMSELIFYTLMPQINAEDMIPNGVEQTLCVENLLKWKYYYSNELENYILTILDSEGNLLLRNDITPGNYIGGSEEWPIPPEVELQPGLIYYWRVDVGASYINGVETAGSESDWAAFTYQDL
jgi:hypothetical protein